MEGVPVYRMVSSEGEGGGSPIRGPGGVPQILLALKGGERRGPQRRGILRSKQQLSMVSPARVKGAAAPYRGPGGVPPDSSYSQRWGGEGRASASGIRHSEERSTGVWRE